MNVILLDNSSTDNCGRMLDNYQSMNHCFVKDI